MGRGSVVVDQGKKGFLKRWVIAVSFRAVVGRSK
jgi:hypothetical protein